MAFFALCSVLDARDAPRTGLCADPGRDRGVASRRRRRHPDDAEERPQRDRVPVLVAAGAGDRVERPPVHGLIRQAVRVVEDGRPGVRLGYPGMLG